MARSPDEIAVRAWVLAALAPYAPNAEVIYSDQRGERPPKPYVTVLKVSAPGYGEKERSYTPQDAPSVDADFTIRQRRLATFRITVYGADHDQLAMLIDDSTADDVISDANRTNGITVAYALSGPIRLSRNTNGVTEDRTTTDYAVRLITSRTRTQTDLIDKAIATPEE